MSVQYALVSFVARSQVATAASFTQRSGIEPSRSWELGDVSGRDPARRPRRGAGWVLHRRSESPEALEVALGAVLDQLGGHHEELARLRELFEMRLHCSADSDSEQGGFALSAALIDRLGELGRIGVDLWCTVYLQDPTGDLDAGGPQGVAVGTAPGRRLLTSPSQIAAALPRPSPDAPPGGAGVEGRSDGGGPTAGEDAARTALSALEGWQVTRVSLDHQVGLLLAAPDDSSRASADRWITLGTPFTLQAGGVHELVDPATGAGCAHLPALLHARVASARLDGAAGLSLILSTATTLHVPADERYESWQVGAEDGQMVICTPGGELATWAP